MSTSGEENDDAGLAEEHASTPAHMSYKDAGVDIERAAQTKQRMAAIVRSTYGPEVLGGHGRFGGLFDIQWLQLKKDPVLVASTDGVGTKTMIAAALGRFETLGHDLVNHCIDDILVQGAKPLFFLDYIASSQLDPDRVLQIVNGISEACRRANCALLGGETAEMPGVYQPGEIDLVGAIVGWVERSQIIDGSRIAAGDVLIGLPSSGLHTNGYSLARKALAATPLDMPMPDGTGTLGDALLAPHRSYLEPVTRLMARGVDIKGLVHITGGGFYENIPRVLPPGLGVRIEQDAWPTPDIFRLIQQAGHISSEEMYHVFNMGVGLIVIVSPKDVSRTLGLLSDDSYRIGEVTAVSDDSPRVAIV